MLAVTCTGPCLEETAFLADLPDSQLQLTASSYRRDGLSADDSRLNALASWSAADNDTNPYIQADLGGIKQIVAIATKGRGSSDYAQWVTSYTISCSTIDDDSTYINVPTTFPANSDKNTVMKHSIVPAVAARYVRLHPQTWHDHPSLRWEIYGCDHATSGMVYLLHVYISFPAV